jgi:hypothetical protein
MRNLNERLNERPIGTDEKQIDDQPQRGVVTSIADRQRTRIEGGKSIISASELETLRTRWMSVQTAFVDEPQRAVKDADGLVSSAIEQISKAFHDQRAKLEEESRSGEVSTETLRRSLQQYRTFFDRLLSV